MDTNHGFLYKKGRGDLVERGTVKRPGQAPYISLREKRGRQVWTFATPEMGAETAPLQLLFLP